MKPKPHQIVGKHARDAALLVLKEGFALKNVRVWFQKIGTVKYISHLDLTRCMARALKLSRLPVWYTEGFNPRIYMSFAMPLSLGVSGERECMDVRFMEDADLTEAASRLRTYLPEDLSILEMTEPLMTFESIAFAEYEFRIEAEEPSQLAETIDRLLSSDSVLVKKHSKKGDREVDIKPSFSNMKKSITEEALVLQVPLPCTLEGSVNPNLLLEALKSHCGLDLYAQIIRKRLLTKDFSDIR